MKLNRGLREFVELLNSHEVCYLIVGAYALAYHGRPRSTGDIDVFLDTRTDNASRVLQVIEEFGFSSLGLSLADLQVPGHMIQFGVSPFRIDLLTGLTGVDFEDAWERREYGNLQGIRVAFIGKEDLIKNKMALGRPQDLVDIDELRRLDELE